jgi:hypothetical protein
VFFFTPRIPEARVRLTARSVLPAWVWVVEWFRQMYAQVCDRDARNPPTVAPQSNEVVLASAGLQRSSSFESLYDKMATLPIEAALAADDTPVGDSDNLVDAASPNDNSLGDMTD